LFSTTGVFRYFYKEKNNAGATNGNCFSFIRNSGAVTCIIKNISFKPLNQANPLTLFNTVPEQWEQISCSIRPARQFAVEFDGADDYGQFDTDVVLEDDWEVSVMFDTDTLVWPMTKDILNKELFFKLSLSPQGRPSFLVGDGTAWRVTLTSGFDISVNTPTTITGRKQGNNYTLLVNNVVVATSTTTLAVTPRISHVGRRSTISTAFHKGFIYYIKINGQFYPLDRVNQAIQPSKPDNGNPITLFNVVNEQWKEITPNTRPEG
jgi:hypothetical protein